MASLRIAWSPRERRGILVRPGVRTGATHGMIIRAGSKAHILVLLQSLKHMSPETIIENIPDTYVAESRIHGRGLFAARPFGSGEVLATLDGQIVPWELYRDNPVAPEWNALPGDRLLVRPYATRYRFINHARSPNVGIETEKLTLHVLEPIEADEELTLDYRAEPLPDEYLAMPDKGFL